MRQVGDGMLLGREVDAIGLAAVGNDGVAGDAQLAGRRQHAHAFVAEAVDVRRDRTRRAEAQPVGVTRSGVRDGCTFSMKIIGVACADS